MNAKTWRVARPHSPEGMRECHEKSMAIAARTDISEEEKDLLLRDVMHWFPATRFFDQMSFIGDAHVGCIVLETSEGLIQIDCMNDDSYSVSVIEDGYKQLGLDIHDLKAILITHGHGDHYGNAGYFREQYGTKLYMSKVDYEFASAEDPMSRHAPLAVEMDGFLEEGKDFVLGDMSIQVYSTPGHTPGGVSFIFPVTDEGRQHMACIWGGTGAPGGCNKEEVIAKHNQYLASIDHFTSAILANGVDVEISAHPFVDNAVQKLALCREIFDGIPNPFVSTTADVCRFMEMLRGRINRSLSNADAVVAEFQRRLKR